MTNRTTGYILQPALPNFGCAIHPMAYATVSLLLLLGTSHSSAQSSDTSPVTVSKEDASGAQMSPHASRETQLIILSGFLSTEEIDIIKQSITAQLADLDTNVVIHAKDILPAAADDMMRVTQQQMIDYGAAVAFVVLQGESEVNLKIVRKTTDGITATDRPVIATQGSPQHEALAVIIRATVLAIRDPESETTPKAAVAKTPPKAPEKVKEIPTSINKKPPSRRPSRRLFAESALAIGHYSADTSTWLGAMLGLNWSPLGQLVIHANYTFFSRVERRTEDVTLQIKRHPILIGLRVNKSWTTFSIGGGMALNVDIVTEETTSHDSFVFPQSDGAARHLGLYGYVQAVGHITDHIHIFVRPGVDLPLRHSQFSMKIEDGTDEVAQTVVVRPQLVQPVIFVGAQLDIL